MTVFAFGLFATAALLLVPCIWALRRWNSPGAKVLSFMSALAIVWTVTDGFWQMSTDLASQIFFNQLSYISGFEPLSAFFLAIDYRSEWKRLRPAYVVALLAIPSITLALVFTNQYHHLIWTSYQPVRANGILLLNATYGAWFWIFESYVYAASLASVVVLARSVWNGSRLHRSQAILFCLGIVAPWAANCVYTFRLGPLKGLDLSPVAVGVSAVFLMLSLFRYRLFDVIPIAYEGVIQNLADGVLVLDRQGQLLGYNPSAARALQLDANVVGTQFVLNAYFPVKDQTDWAGLHAGERRSYPLHVEGSECFFEVSLSPLNRAGHHLGCVLLMHDVTVRHKQSVALETSSAKLQLANRDLSSLNKELELSVQMSEKLVEEASRAQAFIQRILTTTPNIVYIFDFAIRRLVYVNQELSPVLGYTPQQAKDSIDLARLIHPEDRPVLAEHHRRCATLPDGAVLEAEYRVRNAQGTWSWLLSRDCRFTWDEAGCVSQILGTAVDITKRKRDELFLREQEERWLLALHGNDEGLWDWDIANNRTYRSAGWKRIIGYRDDEIGTGFEEWRGRVHPEDLDRVERAIAAHIAAETDQFVSEYRIRSRDGSYRWVMDRGRCVRDELGKASRMAGSQSDITERKRVEQQFVQDALHDSLTRLPNRRNLLEELDRATRSAHVLHLPLSMAIADIDRFKEVNDSNGHAAGDQVLAAFADLLQRGVHDKGFAGRLGGDEFCLLFPNTTAQMAVLSLEQIRVQLETQVFQIAGRVPFQVTATFGVAELSPGMEAKDLLSAADQALYLAKQRGRNQTMVSLSMTTPHQPLIH